MRISQACAKCMYDHQVRVSADEVYLAEVRKIIEQRSEQDTTSELLYRFNEAYRKRFGARDSFADVKRQYNDLVLRMEDGIRSRIESSADPLAEALAFARIGNYIDYGAQNNVDEATFLSLFDTAKLQEGDLGVYESFLQNCAGADTFLLLADNCGEIVLDKLFLEQLRIRFPQLKLQVLVRGGEVLNDVTVDDALYTGIDQIARILSSGKAVAGTVYSMMSHEAQRALDEADVILAKGQANYESLSGTGRHVFYSFLCKCDHFTSKFNVPALTGMLVEEAS